MALTSVTSLPGTSGVGSAWCHRHGPPSHPAPGLQLLILASLTRKLGGFAVPLED